MSAVLSRCRSLPVPAVGLGWAAVLLSLVGLGVVAAPWSLRAAVAGIAAAGAAVWGWQNGTGAARGWIAAVPIAAWFVGAFGWGGAVAAAFAAWVALRRVGSEIAPLRWSHSRRPEPVAEAGAGAVRQESPSDDAATWSDDECEEEDESEPDQWFTRTADAVEGELVVRCENGVGAAHVLFWPAFASPPRVRCHPADGIGRVRAARVLPQGVRFEVVRPDRQSGPVRICYEASTATR